MPFDRFTPLRRTAGSICAAVKTSGDASTMLAADSTYSFGNAPFRPILRQTFGSGGSNPGTRAMSCWSCPIAVAASKGVLLRAGVLVLLLTGILGLLAMMLSYVAA